jgi:hypothetical protein
MNNTTNPKRKFVRIELGLPQFSADKIDLNDKMCDQIFEFRLLSGGYLLDMNCRSENYGDKWRAQLAVHVSAGLHRIAFSETYLRPLERPRLLEQGEVLRSLTSWTIDKFLDREAEEREY